MPISEKKRFLNRNSSGSTYTQKEMKMSFKKIILCVMVLVAGYSLASASELVMREAINYYNEGVAAQMIRHFPEAYTAYEKALLIGPYGGFLKKYLHNNLGGIFYEIGDMEKAEYNYVEALKVDPQYEHARLNLGLVFDKTKDRVSSLEFWTDVFSLESLKPKDFVVKNVPGLLPDKVMALSKVSEFDTIGFSDPRDPNYQKFILNNMGVIYATRGKLDLAYVQFLDALKVDIGYRPAELNIGLIYDKTESRLYALKFWALKFKFEDLKPKAFITKEEGLVSETLFDNPQEPAYQKFIINNMGVIYALRSDWKQAEQFFVAALKIDPEYRPAQLNLGLVYDKTKDQLTQLEYWAKMFDLEAMKPKTYLMVEPLTDADATSSASDLYGNLPLQDPTDPRYQRFIINGTGVVCTVREDWPQAEQYFEEAALIDPNYLPALLNLGLMYDRGKDRLLSLQYWARIFHLDELKPQTVFVEGKQKEEPKQ
jgi:tetratricopeptide (TPR) repeat protein